jgi:RimJ/RimL family protein N-acetyltransferase
MTTLPQPAMPTLLTVRLRLRPFGLADARDVQRLAGAREVFATTLLIPHPYPDGAAESWISTHAPRFAEGSGLDLAIVPKEGPGIIGAIGLTVTAKAHRRAELGYWLGVPWWGRGLMTEAVKAMLAHGFETLGLERIEAHHFVGNAASGRVMAKAGMRHEGCHRRYAWKGDTAHDVEMYAALKGEWPA